MQKTIYADVVHANTPASVSYRVINCDWLQENVKATFTDAETSQKISQQSRMYHCVHHFVTLYGRLHAVHLLFFPTVIAADVTRIGPYQTACRKQS